MDSEMKLVGTPHSYNHVLGLVSQFAYLIRDNVDVRGDAIKYPNFVLLLHSPTCLWQAAPNQKHGAAWNYPKLNMCDLLAWLDVSLVL